jgi:hypothetical protein
MTTPRHTTVTSVAPSPAERSSPAHTEAADYDVVVVGASFAGLGIPALAAMPRSILSASAHLSDCVRRGNLRDLLGCLEEKPEKDKEYPCNSEPLRWQVIYPQQGSFSCSKY